MTAKRILFKIINARLAGVFFSLALGLKSFAGPGAVDTTFNVIPNNPVYSLLTQPDGKILVGGAFTTISGAVRNGLARLFPDGRLDTSFTNSIISGGTVYAMLMQPNGKLLVAGNFGTIPTLRVNVARLNVDGSIDGTFTNSAPSGTVFALGLQNDGKVLIGGQFITVSKTNHNYIARLNADGTVDNMFNPGTLAGTTVNAIAVQNDGNILIGGNFTSFTTQGVNRMDIARLTTNGTVDLTYQPTANSIVQAIFLQDDGRSLWSGTFTTLAGNPRNDIGILNLDGTINNAFVQPNGANSTIYAVTEDPNGNIYLGGIFSIYGGVKLEGLARVFSDGRLDGSFNTTTILNMPQVRCLAIQNDGKVLVGGQFSYFISVGRTNLVRLYGDNYPAEITLQPKSAGVAIGSTVTFSVEVSNPTSVSYQWRKDGINISGATFSEYTLFNAQMADAGVYTVQASSGFGATTSSNALLQVGDVPVVVQPPTNTTVIQGQSTNFTVIATGSSLIYYWLFNRVVVGTNSVLNFASAQSSQAGFYTLVVSNFVGSVTNPSVKLSVLFPVTIVADPTNLAVLSGNPASFFVSATGLPLNYQWLNGGNAIANATDAQFTITNALPADAGGYSVIVSNQFNSVTSSIASLVVGVAPQTLLSHLNADGSLGIQMPGTPGFNYVVQTATNLLAPVLWQNLATNPADTNGLWNYVATNNLSSGVQFYRVTVP